MAICKSTANGWMLTVHSASLDPETLLVSSVRGREAIAQPYQYDLELASLRPDLDLTELLQRPITLTIKQGVTLDDTRRRGYRSLVVHGAFSLLEQGEGPQDREWTCYRATMVPRFWFLSMNVRSRIFLEQSVPEIVETLLRDNGLSSPDYEFRLRSPYARREFVMQYQESDLDFVSRLLEHDGIFYFFEQEQDAEKIVFGDSVGIHPRVLGGEEVLYQPCSFGETGDRAWFRPEVLQRWACRQRVVPRGVRLRDVHDQNPREDLRVADEVVPHGIGEIYEWGDHYRTLEEGRALARVRAEELRSRERVFAGTGYVKTFRAGKIFRLADHPRADFNADYLITEIHHTAEQNLALTAPGAPSATYENTFEAIPADLPFRPFRGTHRPRIEGYLPAVVDATGDGEYAEVDDQGRYKVKLFLDLSGRDSATASCWMHMAQSYGGNGMGMHFPLHRDAPVAVSFENGDPDRPIILGVIPNGETRSVVTGGNQTECRVQSSAGNTLRMENRAGRVAMDLSSPSFNSFVSLGHGDVEGFHMRTDANRVCRIQQNDEDHIGGNQSRRVDGATESTHGGNTTLNHLASLASTVVGPVTAMALNNKTEVTAGNNVQSVGRNEVVAIRGTYTITNTSMTVESLNFFLVRANRLVSLHSKRVLTLRGDRQVRIWSGDSVANWKPNEWTLESPKVDVKAAKDLSLHSDKSASMVAAKLLKFEGRPIRMKSKSQWSAQAETSATIQAKNAQIRADGLAKVIGKGSVRIQGGGVKVQGPFAVNGTNLIVES